METNIFIKEIFEKAPIGILRTNQAGNILMANQKIASILGYDSPQKMIEKVNSIVDIYARKSDREWVLKKIEKQHEIDVELDAKTIDNRIIQTHCIVKSEKENDQTYFTAIITDITEKRSMLKQLMKREAMLNSIINCLPFELVVSDRKGNVLVQNDLSKNVIGDQIGKNILRVDISNSTKKEWEKRVEKVLEGNNINEEDDVEINNKTIYLQRRLAPLIENEEISGVIGFSIDITDLKKLQIELEKHRDKLELMVRDRTKELEKRNLELEQYNQLFEGRELRIKELKDKITELQKIIQSEK